jgi:hypothetical protein
MLKYTDTIICVKFMQVWSVNVLCVLYHQPTCEPVVSPTYLAATGVSRVSIEKLI